MGFSGSLQETGAGCQAEVSQEALLHEMLWECGAAEGTGSCHCTNSPVPGWTRQICCRNWSSELIQFLDMYDKGVPQRSGKRHPVSELWQEEPKRSSCRRCLFVGCITWNVGEWNCFTDKKVGTQKADWEDLTCKNKGRRRMVQGQHVLSLYLVPSKFPSIPL